MVADTLTRKPGLNIRIIDEEVVIVDKDSGDVHQLNPTASFIWQLCDGKTTLEMIITAVVDHYGITYTEAEKDVVTVIENLKSLSLLSS